MPKAGPKPKNASQPRHNLYNYRIPGPFLGDSSAFLQAAKGQDSIDDSIDKDSDFEDETRRRRSWTREQKLGAIKYATSTEQFPSSETEKPTSVRIETGSIQALY
jgi:hypothetical protein